jgi:hypothetical protein
MNLVNYDKKASEKPAAMHIFQDIISQSRLSIDQDTIFQSWILSKAP